MRIFGVLLAAAVILSVASGCAATGGTATNAKNQCQVTRDALAKVVVGAISSPYKMGKICYFGIGKNSGKHGDALGLLTTDLMEVAYNRSNVESLYRAGSALPGSKPLLGVGSAARYWDRGDGNAQVFARSDQAFCWVVPNFSTASEAGLSNASDSRIIAQSDVAALATKLGGVCNALFG